MVIKAWFRGSCLAGDGGDSIISRLNIVVDSDDRVVGIGRKKGGGGVDSGSSRRRRSERGVSHGLYVGSESGGGIVAGALVAFSRTMRSRVHKSTLSFLSLLSVPAIVLIETTKR